LSACATATAIRPTAGSGLLSGSAIGKINGLTVTAPRVLLIHRHCGMLCVLHGITPGTWR